MGKRQKNIVLNLNKKENSLDKSSLSSFHKQAEVELTAVDFYADLLLDFFLVG